MPSLSNKGSCTHKSAFSIVNSTIPLPSLGSSMRLFELAACSRLSWYMLPCHIIDCAEPHWCAYEALRIMIVDDYGTQSVCLFESLSEPEAYETGVDTHKRF